MGYLWYITGILMAGILMDRPSGNLSTVCELENSHRNS